MLYCGQQRRVMIALNACTDDWALLCTSWQHSYAILCCAISSQRHSDITTYVWQTSHYMPSHHITSPHPSPAAQWLLEEWWSWRRTKECRPLLSDSTINRAMQRKERRENEMKLVVLVNWIAHLYPLLSSLIMIIDFQMCHLLHFTSVEWGFSRECFPQESIKQIILNAYI